MEDTQSFRAAGGGGNKPIKGESNSDVENDDIEPNATAAGKFRQRLVLRLVVRIGFRHGFFTVKSSGNACSYCC